MQAIIVGFTHSEGISKKNGAAFDIKSLIVLHPAGNVSRENFRKLGVGYEPGEIPVAPSAQGKFVGLTYPCHADIQLDQEFFAGNLRSIAVGVSNAFQLVPKQDKQPQA